MLRNLYIYECLSIQFIYRCLLEGTLIMCLIVTVEMFINLMTYYKEIRNTLSKKT